MNELNNVQTSTEETTTNDEFIFEEETPSTEEDNENIESEEQSTEVKETVDNTQNSIKIKYNGSERVLSYDEAVTLAQKGMNYDKLLNNYDSLRNSPELKIFDKQAESLNMSRKEYAEYLDSFQLKSLENKALQQLQEAYPDSDVNVLKQLAKNEVDNYLRNRENEEYQRELESKKIEDDEISSQIERFINVYPEVDIEHLPQEVLEYMVQGEDILSAYRAYENNLLRNRLAAQETNNKNKNKAVGNLTSNNSSDNESDYFLLGLIGK